MAATEQGGIEALHRLKSSEPPLYLSPSPDLSDSARLASRYIFSTLNPFTPKSPFDQLLTDGFDAEQIWQQIDLQSKPLLSTLRRQVNQFENNPNEISKLFSGIKEGKKTPLKSESDNVVGLEDMEEEFDFDDEQDEDGDEDEESGESENEEEDGEEEDGEEEDGGVGVEDKFFKMKELEEYLEEDEAREYGLKRKKKKGDGEVPKEDESSEEDEFDDGGGINEEDEEEDEDDEDEDNLGLFGDGLDDEDDEELGNVRYEDFFVPQKKNVQKKKSKPVDDSDDMDTDDEQEDDKVLDIPKQNLSTHEKEQESMRSKIEQMERANLEPRTWTMQGEVTAAKRPKNSALEVDLDFEHNVRPAPVITEEVTASLEELIKKRILEGRFDDVQRAPALASRAPKETKEMDENKSKKGLAEIYEDEYVQKTGLVSAALSFTDEQKKEARWLFKKICFKLDALSHFHFTPKPVIEDMSVQVNVPALAIEEIAPLAVSDAAMLAPEEVFDGKGDIKAEAELTQEERRRRRANKKRKYKAVAENIMAVKKARDSVLQETKPANGAIET